MFQLYIINIGHWILQEFLSQTKGKKKKKPGSGVSEGSSRLLRLKRLRGGKRTGVQMFETRQSVQEALQLGDVLN